MAASDARPLPLKGIAYRVTFPIFDADGDLVSGAAGLDSEVSKDGGTFGDCTNEATEIATSSGMYFLDLTATEMNADTVAVIVKTSTSGAKTTPIVLYPVESGDISVNVEQISGDATAADNAESFFDGTGYAGTNNTIPTVTTAGLSAAAVDLIWDEATSGHTAAGSTGKALTDANNGTPPTAGAIADAVWDEARVDHSAAGSFGQGAASVQGNVTGSVGSVTGNVGGNVTGSVGSVASGGITAASIATGAIDADALAADAGTELATAVWAAGTRTLTASSDPTAAQIADAVWDEATSGHTTAGSTGKALTDANNGTPPTAGAIADAVWDETAADHSTAGTTGKALQDAGAAGTPPSAADIADAVWDEQTSGHTDVGSTGAALTAAGSAGDPWSTALPGAYGAGTAGKLIGDNLDAAVSSRAEPGDAMALEADAVSASALSAAAVDEILDEPIEGAITLRQALRIVMAGLAGRSTGGGTSTVTFRDVANTKARISATVDASGNRTTITLDGS